MYSTVVFDFDGTLVDSNAIKRHAFLEAVADHPDGTERMDRVLRRVLGDRRSIFDAYAADAMASGARLSDDAAEMVRRYSERVDAAVASAAEMKGATPLLDRLRSGGARLFLSSATPLENLRRIVERRGWQHHFEAVFGHPASKLDSILHVLRLTGHPPKALAVVGDGLDDRASALASGASFFSVGEARGALLGERAYGLAELAGVLMQPERSRAAAGTA